MTQHAGEILRLDGEPKAPPPLLGDDLVAAAGALDVAAASAEAPTVQTNVRTAVQPPIDWKAEAHELVDFVVGTFADFSPRLDEVWSPQRRDRVERRLARVMEKHNLDMARIFGTWGAEIMLTVAVVPAIPASYVAVRDDIKDLKAKAAEKDKARPPAGQAAAQPPPAVRTYDQGAAAPPDPLKLHEATRTGQEGQGGPPPPTDAVQLHRQV